MHKGTPYVLRSPQLSDNIRPWQSQYADQARIFRELELCTADERSKISALTSQYGSEVLLALSGFYQDKILPISHQAGRFGAEKAAPWLLEEKNDLSSAGLTAIAKRTDGFATALKNYQQSLEKLRTSYQARAPKAELVKLEQAAKNAHEKLNTRFRAEMSQQLAKAKSRRGNTWSNAQRGINIAKSARSDAPLQLSNTAEVARLRNLSKAVNYGGNGLLILDAGFRANGVHNDYQQGKDWQRSAVQETVGLSSSFFGGLAAANAAVGVASIFLAATPAGWVAIIAIGASAGFVGAEMGNTVGKTLAGAIYDASSSMTWF